MKIFALSGQNRKSLNYIVRLNNLPQAVTPCDFLRHHQIQALESF